MIEITNLYKRYHNHHGSPWVLQDINLTIPNGLSVGLVGRNGAGKSTLLRLIAGMDHPDRGRIQRSSRVSWPMGLTGGFQATLTARQNVKFVARVHGGRTQEKAIIQRVQEFAELGDAFDEPIRTYSSGMRARLNFGLSLAFDFDVYLSDEATSVGDRAFRAKAAAAFKDRIGQSSLIMVSHSEGILKELCQAGIYLRNGRATWFDDVEEAIEAYHQAEGPPDRGEAEVESVLPLGTPLVPAAMEAPLNKAEALAQIELREKELEQARETHRQSIALGLVNRDIRKYGDAARAVQQKLKELRQGLRDLGPE